MARALSVIGDRWTLLILRDCFRGTRRFERFQESLGVTRHVLADRLRKLETAGVLERKLYQERPARHEYRLTERGLDLQPVLMSLVGWADRHLPLEDGPPLVYEFRDTGEPVEPQLTDARTGRAITPRNIRARMRAADPS
ncbi:helix-turn-helix domain-containing protein [Albimonas sp. CAU 1670]|uniref:winged helix-turn-helix transcriptional regulator n=1 Tax=Albimonas sp. CAU 1670 TaxID=3032599 RepID=UPI0023DAF7AB|nr:helix-turn-helix domain-containing protein [Albimonas sp. CAU 1670]MDF2234908.1 helix-turn-helix domain-containing protein [Albimonas sp. CAU 1670]